MGFLLLFGFFVLALPKSCSRIDRQTSATYLSCWSYWLTPTASSFPCLMVKPGLPHGPWHHFAICKRQQLGKVLYKRVLCSQKRYGQRGWNDVKPPAINQLQNRTNKCIYAASGQESHHNHSVSTAASKSELSIKRMETQQENCGTTEEAQHQHAETTVDCQRSRLSC